MDESWAVRQRRTRTLVRGIAKHLFSEESITPDQLVGLSMLTWITNSYDGDAPHYIQSTKIPALKKVLKVPGDWSMNLNQVAFRLQEFTKNSELVQLSREHSGFTNFYKVYRNSVARWVNRHFDTLLPMYIAAFKSKNNRDRRRIVEGIEALPRIAAPNDPGKSLPPEHFLTPIFFALDPDLRFPIMNGSKNVTGLLRKLHLQGATLSQKFDAMILLYGRNGINDAADLDFAGPYAADFISVDGSEATKRFLELKAVDGRDLPLKDDADVLAVTKAGTNHNKRIHNKLTNRLLEIFAARKLFEGSASSNLYDVMIPRYDGESDLLIEAKSIADAPNIRMAIGQLLHYEYESKKTTMREIHLAILVPHRPSDEIIAFLDDIHVGLLWFEGNELQSEDEHFDTLLNK